MTPKEILLVIGGAIVLTNIGIVGTLIGSGFFSNGNNNAAAVEAKESEVVAEETPEEEEPPPLPPHHNQRHFMSKAIFICEDKIRDSNSSKTFGFEYDTVASRFSEEEQTYKLFFTLQTASRVYAPMEEVRVTCEVFAEDMSISGYKAMKN